MATKKPKPVKQATPAPAAVSPFTPAPVAVVNLNLAPPLIPQITYTALPEDQQAALSEAWNPFSHLQHEARMNEAIMNQTSDSNAQKIIAYTLRYKDWRTNAELYLNCRPPIQPPPPPPAPTLENVGPMPPGYWYGQH